jgi:Fe-S-cluster containining protein
MRAMNPGNDADDGAAITCASCEACCCRLEVLLMGDDAVPPQFSARDRWGGSVMRREADGWCAALDRNTMRCTIYARRPTVCREFPVGEGDCIEERRQLVARPPDARVAFVSW